MANPDTLNVCRLIDRRAVPAHGPDVHVYDFRTLGFLIRLHHAEIVEQESFPTFIDALEAGRQLADQYGCALIQHHPYANREGE
jgi:hypothetical protein